MSRFPSGAGRERAISEYLPTNQRAPGSSTAPDKLGSDGAAVRGTISQDLSNRACDKFRTAHPQVSPRDAYDNLRARGLIDDPTGSRRPAADANWGSVHNGRDWPVRAVGSEGGISAADARAMGTEVSGTGFPTTHASVVADTQRHSYVASAREDYVRWATSAPPAGRGLTAEQANTAFSTTAARVGLTNPDGSVRSDWDPNASTGPAASFYRGTAEHPIFGEDGTVNSGVRSHDYTSGSPYGFQHGASDPIALAANPSTDLNSLDPVTRAQVTELRTLQARNATYAVLTGENASGANPPVRFETTTGGGREAILPDGSRYPVVGLTPTEARIFMRSRGLTDDSGNPSATSTPDGFGGVMLDARSRTLTRDTALAQAAEFERTEISRTLSGPPYNLRGQPDKVVNFMAGQGWLGSNPDLAAMDSFRTRAATAGGTEVAAVRSDVVNSPTARPPSSAESFTATGVRTTVTGRAPGETRGGAPGGGGPTGGGAGSALEIERMRGEYGLQQTRISSDASIRSATISAEASREQAAATRYSADRTSEAQLQGARISAEAQRDAARMGMMGQIASAFIGMFGQMLSSAMQGSQSTQAAIIQGMYSRR